MGSDQRPRLHPGSGAQPAGRNHARPLRDRLGGRQVQLDFFIQRVRRALQIGLTVPHVAPVALRGGTEYLFFLPQQQGEQIFSKIEGPPLGHIVHRPPGQHIDASIHLIGNHLTPAGFLHKALDPSLSAGQHQAVFQGCGVPVQGQGRGGALLLVELEQLRQIQIAHSIAADHQKIFLPQLLHAVLHAPGGAKRFFLYKIGQPDAQARSVPKIFHNTLGPVAQGHADVGEPMPAQQGNDVFHHRLVKQGHHRLGQTQGHRPQPPSLPAGHDYSFHLTHTPSAALPQHSWHSVFPIPARVHTRFA